MRAGVENAVAAKVDAILILGGGVREGGELPPWARARYDLALQRQAGEPLICLSAGTTHRPPPLDNTGFPVLECIAGARHLMSQGIPARQIRLETASYDTVGNAYFAKLLHVDPAGWSRLLVITSESHMPRTRAIFEWVFGFEPGTYRLHFAASADVGLTPEQDAARRRKEQEALDLFRRESARISDLRELNEWIFTRHRAYAADRDFSGIRTRDEALASTY
jgi:uncharacterized SAM-binding protein YcdF (DUF218 family)